MAQLQQAVAGLVTETAEEFGFADQVAALRANLG